VGDEKSKVEFTLADSSTKKIGDEKSKAEFIEFTLADGSTKKVRIKV
jgi:hypothetical protein